MYSTIVIKQKTSEKKLVIKFMSHLIKKNATFSGKK